MRRSTKATAMLLLGAAVLGSAYVAADGADLVPGFFTFAPPLPKVMPFPTPKPVEPKAVEPPLFGTQTDADQSFFKKISADFVGDYRVKDSEISLWIGDLDGIELASYQPNKALSAASTTKLLTAAATLSEFGSEARARTVVAWDNKTRRLYLIGGGDVLLGVGTDTTENTNGYAGLGTLAEDTAKKLVDKSGNSLLAKSPYTLVYDTSWFGSETKNSAWRPQDTQWAAPIQGLAVNAGHRSANNWGYHSDPALAAAQAFAASLGNLVSANLSSSVASNNENAKAGSPEKIVSGKSKLADGYLLDPSSESPSAVPDPQKSTKPEVVAYSEGAPFALVVRKMLKDSDNTIAETLGRMVALHRGKKPDFTAAGEAVMGSLTDLGVSLGATKMRGCSGLAHGTRIPAKVLAEVVMLSSDGRHSELHSLGANMPVAGADGTLASSYKGTAAAGNLRGKTGTLSVSNSLAGTFVYHNQILVYGLVIADYPRKDTEKTVQAKQMFFGGILGDPTDFSPTDPDDPSTEQSSVSSEDVERR